MFLDTGSLVKVGLKNRDRDRVNKMEKKSSERGKLQRKSLRNKKKDLKTKMQNRKELYMPVEHFNLYIMFIQSK